MSLQLLALSWSYSWVFFCGVSCNSVVATSGAVIVDELVIDDNSLLSIEIMNSVFFKTQNTFVLHFHQV